MNYANILAKMFPERKFCNVNMFPERKFQNTQMFPQRNFAIVFIGHTFLAIYLIVIAKITHFGSRKVQIDSIFLAKKIANIIFFLYLCVSF